RLDDRYEIVGHARVKGLYIAVEFVSERERKTRAVELARAVHFACLERGIVDIYDRGQNVVRWQPALTMPPDMFHVRVRPPGGGDLGGPGGALARQASCPQASQIAHVPSGSRRKRARSPQWEHVRTW